ncbi:MAG: sugar-binding protein [Armatimonadota bacterium]
MRSCIQLLLLFTAAGALMAAILVNTPPEYLILKPQRPITIDGLLNEWDMARTAYFISAFSNDPLITLRPTSTRNDADQSGRVALAWDDTYLYVAGQMADDQLLGARPDSAGNQGPAPWFCDSLIVHLASFRQSLKANSPYHIAPFLGLRYAPMGSNPRGKLLPNDRGILDARDLYWKVTEHTHWQVRDTTDGYAVEAAIPWSDLNFHPSSGEPLYLGFLAADIDPGRGLNQIGWGFSNDPKKQPLFRLAERSDVLGMLTVSRDEQPLGAAWAVRTEVIARTTPAKLTGLRVVDAKGVTVARDHFTMEVPVGMTGIELREIKAGVVSQPGPYIVEALTNGDRVLARVSLRIVAPALETSVITSLPNQINHMEPDRLIHNAMQDHRDGFYRHGFVRSKEDYVPFMRRHIEPTLKEDVRADIRSRNGWACWNAIQCLAIYKITGDEEYKQLARDTMDLYLDVYAQGKGENSLLGTRLHGLNLYRYLTWKDDPTSEFAPKDAEKRYRTFLRKLAAHTPDDFFSESGTHNRVWQRYAAMKIFCRIAEEDGTPLDPRIITFTDYHDKLIGEVGDSDDASANYHWVFFNAAMSLYFYTGDWDAFRNNKGFTKTLSRYVEMVSPGGACPPFASGNGWHEVGMGMWAYELMSRVTRDGRYRWTSQRIAEYYYNHTDDRFQQYHIFYDGARNNFAVSYLIADDTVIPKEPPAGSRITWRHPNVPTTPEQLKRGGFWHTSMDGSRWIPDKIILSSGNQAQSLWGLVELLPLAGHGGELPGNIHALMQQDAALLAGQGYFDNTPDLQNILWIEDLDGVPFDPGPLATEVPLFIDDPAFTFARISTTAYQHLPVTYTRDIFFAKNGFLVVKDRVKFEALMKVRLGPCYNTRILGPECGAHWFNTYYDRLYYTSLGLGKAGQIFRNPAWDLLVYFSPRADRKHTVTDRYQENPFRGSPIQLRQTWSGMARAGQEVTFTSVLLPHAPMLNPSALLTPPADSKDPKRIEIVRDDDNLTVLKVISEVGRGETWLMLNDTGKPAQAGPLESDGRIAVVVLDAKGAIQQRAVAGGTLLRFRGIDESAGARKLPVGPLVRPAEFTQ